MDGAEKAYRAAITAKPGHADAHMNLGILLNRRAVQLERAGGNRNDVAALYEECAGLWEAGMEEGNAPRAALANAARAKAGQPLPLSRCVLGHELAQEAPDDGGWTCDVCGLFLDEGAPPGCDWFRKGNWGSVHGCLP